MSAPVVDADGYVPGTGFTPEEWAKVQAKKATETATVKEIAVLVERLNTVRVGALSDLGEYLDAYRKDLVRALGLVATVAHDEDMDLGERHNAALKETMNLLVQAHQGFDMVEAELTAAGVLASASDHDESATAGAEEPS